MKDQRVRKVHFFLISEQPHSIPLAGDPGDAEALWTLWTILVTNERINLITEHIEGDGCVLDIRAAAAAHHLPAAPGAPPPGRRGQHR